MINVVMTGIAFAISSAWGEWTRFVIDNPVIWAITLGGIVDIIKVGLLFGVVCVVLPLLWWAADMFNR